MKSYRINPFIINNEEYAGFIGLSMLAKTIYILGLRPHMNYNTGIAGGIKRKISYQGLREIAGFDPDPGSTKELWRASKDELRSAMRELIRAGLIKNSGSCKDLGLVYWLCFATTNNSDPIRNPTGTPQEQHQADASGNNTSKTSGGAELDKRNSTESDTGTPLNGEAVSPTPRVSDNLSINNHHQHTDSSVEQGGDDDGFGNVISTQAGKLAKLLRDAGVDCTSQHPTLVEWVAAGVTIEQANEWIDLARQYKPKPQRIHINYLNTIRNNQQAQQHHQSMRPPRDDAELQDWARDHGLPDARMGELPDVYRRRLRDLATKCETQNRFSPRLSAADRVRQANSDIIDGSGVSP